LPGGPLRRDSYWIVRLERWSVRTLQERGGINQHPAVTVAEFVAVWLFEGAYLSQRISTVRRTPGRSSIENKGFVMVGAAGLEPATLCLEGRCSIQLSYAPAVTFFDSKPLPRSNPHYPYPPFLAKTVSKLSQNPSVSPVSPDCLKTLRLFSGAAIELQVRLSPHLQFHLRVLLKTFESPCRKSCVTHSSARHQRKAWSRTSSEDRTAENTCQRRSKIPQKRRLKIPQ
jgi:hypothetical protein